MSGLKALTIVGACFFVAQISVVAASSSAGVYHQVKSGETLDVLAQRYRVPVYEIAKANRVRVNDKIHPGTRVYIPAGLAQPKPQPVTFGPVGRSTSSTSSSSRSSSANTTRSSQTSSSSTNRSAAPPFAGATQLGGSGQPTVVASSFPNHVEVKKGDTLWGIASRYDITVKALASANGLNSSKPIEIGQKLKIPSKSSGSSSSISSSSSRSTPTGTQTGTTRTSTLGSTGSSSSVSKSGYIWPVEGKILKTFKNNSTDKHFGVDIKVPYGTSLKAAKSGKVVYVGKIPAYGRMVIVNHSGGMASCYAFCSEILVDQGDGVSRGETIARSGDPKKTDTPYFHFQLRKNGDALNPLPYLPSN